MSISNIEIKLKKTPTQNYPKVNQEIFQVYKLPQISKSQLPEGHILVQTKFISIDAAMRVWISGFKSYRKPVLPGDVMPAGVIGQVLQSNGAKQKVGDLVLGEWGWTTYAVVKGQQVTSLPKGIQNPEDYLGLFGISGLTAYAGLFKVGKLKKGDTVLVSAAAGACGEIVVQLAKNFGCEVIGIAGSQQKCKYVQSIGAKSCINYNKLTQSLQSTMRKHCPKGVDVYFDNVGGETLDAALMNIRQGSRIVLCGSISTYYGRSEPYKLKNYPRLIIKKCVMQGFIVLDYKKDFVEMIENMTKQHKEGKLKSRIDWSYGLEQAPNALRKLLLGGNSGKVIVKIQDQQRPSL